MTKRKILSQVARIYRQSKDRPTKTVAKRVRLGRRSTTCSPRKLDFTFPRNEGARQRFLWKMFNSSYCSGTTNIMCFRWRITRGIQKEDDDTHAVKLVAAKSRVAPIKQLTIPRLELQAAVLASRLGKSIQEESRLQFTDVKFFTDSTIALAWITNSSRSFKPFVSSRVGEIQSTTDPNQWNHIPSEDNVADDLSRGIRVIELQGRWMNGPKFLRLPEDQWPIQQTPPPPEEYMERRQIHVLTAVAAQKAKAVIDPSTFSSWRKLTRVTARTRRLADKIWLRKFGQHHREGQDH